MTFENEQCYIKLKSGKNEPKKNVNRVKVAYVKFWHIYMAIEYNFGILNVFIYTVCITHTHINVQFETIGIVQQWSDCNCAAPLVPSFSTYFFGSRFGIGSVHEWIFDWLYRIQGTYCWHVSHMQMNSISKCNESLNGYNTLADNCLFRLKRKKNVHCVLVVQFSLFQFLCQFRLKFLISIK